MAFVTVPKNTLLLIAGLVWCVAGAMVCKIGLPLLWSYEWRQPLLLLWAVVVFLLFYFLIFSRLVVKHTARIRAKAQPHLPFWEFFDTSSYIVMVIMIVMASHVTVRIDNCAHGITSSVPDYLAVLAWATC